MKKCGLNIFIWIIIGIILGMHLFTGNIEGAWSWWPFFAFMIFAYVNIYIHEFGHVLAGVAVKFPIRRVTIGLGREIARKQFGETFFIITSGFGGGLTYIGHVSEQVLKLRFLIFVLGGVVAQGFAIALTMLIFNIQIHEVWPLSPPLSLAKIFIYSNLFLILLNLFPRKFTMFGIRIPSDGLRIVKLPFLKPHEIQEILSVGKIMEAYDLYEAKKYSEAEIEFRECVELYPVPLLPKVNISAVLIKQLKLDETVALLESLQDEYVHDPYVFLLYNNLAWAYLLQGNEEALQKADRYSYKAFQLNPKHPNVIGTRGCVCIETGEVEAGMRLLMSIVNLRKPLDEKTNNPVGFIYLAYAYYLKNDRERNLQYINKLKTSEITLDQDYRLLLEHIVQKTENFTKEVTEKIRENREYHNDEQLQQKSGQLLRGSTFVFLVILSVVTIFVLLYFASN